MRSGILISWIVVVLCACAAAVERPAQISPGDILIMASGDPNDPNGVVDPNKTWDPAEHLVADWEVISVNMTSSLYNPTMLPGATAPDPQWSLSLRSTLEIIDGNGLIGYSIIPTSARAFDQDGGLVSTMTASSRLSRLYMQPHYVTRPTGPNGEWVTELIFNQVFFSLPMEPDVAYPDVLSRIEWSTNVLVAQETKTVDIPFAASETWVEVTPGFEVLVEQATVEDAKYQYRIQIRYDNTEVDALMGGSIHLWRDEALPSVVILDMDVLNSEGKSIRGLGGGSFSMSGSYGGSNNQTTGTESGTGSCDACGTAATFRYTLAFDLYELEASLVLENIPVPHF
ncbi:MAG: hypothetical protein ABFE13_06850 [Phycisphaerales bacterium]